MKPKSAKTYAFIDTQNLKMGIEKETRYKLDFARFRVYLKDKYKVDKAFLFLGFMDNKVKKYDELIKAGYELILKPTLKIKKGRRTYQVKGNVDAELVLHTMINFRKFDKAIIVSGDGDFHCLVEHLHNRKKLAKIIVPNGQYSSLLRTYAKYIVSVNLFIEKVCRK